MQLNSSGGRSDGVGLLRLLWRQLESQALMVWFSGVSHTPTAPTTPANLFLMAWTLSRLFDVFNRSAVKDEECM